MEKRALRRVVVIGSSCSGKSTFAKALSKKLGSKYIELDALHWLPNWVERSDGEMLELLNANMASSDAWVIDGNYQRLQQHFWPEANSVVWLNYSFWRVFGRCIRRTWHRLWSRKPICGENRESLRMLFSKDSIVLWVIRTYWSKRRRTRALRASGRFAHITWLEFKSPRVAERWLTD